MNRPPALHCAALIAFLVMGVAGLVFLAVGPVALIRLFGLVALIAAIGGCAIHAILVRVEAPACWDGLKARFGFISERRPAGEFPGGFTAAAS